MRVQLQQLRYFVSVADTGHFTRSAELTGVSQPTLSKQIHRLEHTLGAALFDRASTGVTLTVAGETLLPLARQMISDADAAHDAVREIVGLRRGRVRLGATPSLCTSLLPPLLKRFHTAYPDIELLVHESGSQDLVADLLARTLDLALIVEPDGGTDPALHTQAVLRENLVVASAAGGPPPAAPGELLHLTDLRDVPLVMFRVGYDLRDVTSHACRQAGFAPRFAIEGGEMDAVLSFVEAGLGLAIVPSMVLVNRPLLRATQVAGPGLTRTIALAHRRESVLPHAAEALRGTLLGLVGAGWLPAGADAV